MDMCEGKTEGLRVSFNVGMRRDTPRNSDTFDPMRAEWQFQIQH